MLMKTFILLKFLFLCILFFFSCTTRRSEIDTKDREKIQLFLNQFLFVNSGAYTLFGDKPITEMFLFVGSDDDLMELTEEELKTAIPLDRSIVDNWKTWKRYIDKISCKNFIIKENACLLDPTHTIYSVLNVKSVKRVLGKHREAFQRVIGSSFDTDKVIEEFKDSSSYFWNKVFEDHYLSGLLFGYGEENIAYFLDCMATQNTKIHFSDEYNPLATVNNFPLPSFALSAEDKTSDCYREQRIKIKKLCQDKDIIDLTIQRLME
jgi:hypothetical protein